MSDPIADVATAVALGCRARQEDVVTTRFADGAETGLAVLSDGMGGHEDGDLAASVIVSALSGVFSAAGPRGPLERAQLRARLLDGVHAANDRLRHEVEAGTGAEGMGGTVVAAYVEHGMLSWISVGDSALYLFRDGTLRRLNQDHSFGPQIDLLAARGVMDAETARTHPQRGCLTSALVGAEIASIDCPSDPVALMDGDIVLMASDGLGALDGAQIAEILAGQGEAPSERIAEALLEAVARAGDPDQDNASVIVIKPSLPRADLGARIPCAGARHPVMARLLSGIAHLRTAFAAAAMDRFVR